MYLYCIYYRITSEIKAFIDKNVLNTDLNVLIIVLIYELRMIIKDN